MENNTYYNPGPNPGPNPNYNPNANYNPNYNNQMPQAPAPTSGGNVTLFSVLAYIPLLWLIGLLVNPECKNPYVRHNVNNGIVIDIFHFGIAIVLVLLGVLLALAKLGGIASLFGWIVSVGFLIIRIIGIIYVAQKNTFVLPVVDKIKIVK